MSSEIAASLAYLLFYAKRPAGAPPPALSPAAAERERLFQHKAKENMAKVLSANPPSSSFSSSSSSSSSSFASAIRSGGFVGGISANLSLLLTGSTNALSSTWGTQGVSGGGGVGLPSLVLEPHKHEHPHSSKGRIVAPHTENSEAANGISFAFANLPSH